MSLQILFLDISSIQIFNSAFHKILKAAFSHCQDARNEDYSSHYLSLRFKKGRKFWPRGSRLVNFPN